MRKAIVFGAGGFIGSHLVKNLKENGFWVKGVDLKYPDFSETAADEFIIGDLRDPYLVKDVLDSLEAFNLETKTVEILHNADCRFGYRESVFKQEYKGKYVICSVTFRLSKCAQFNTNYTAVNEELKRMNIAEYSAKSIATAITNIRKSKLPEPSEIGSAGSFFKNPTVTEAVYHSLKTQYPNIVAYPVESGVKLAAGWLIEQAGWKGFRAGDAGVHAQQALVLVNYGQATGTDILNLAQQIMDSVKSTFGVELIPEVNVL